MRTQPKENYMPVFAFLGYCTDFLPLRFLDNNINGLVHNLPSIEQVSRKPEQNFMEREEMIGLVKIVTSPIYNQ